MVTFASSVLIPHRAHFRLLRYFLHQPSQHLRHPIWLHEELTYMTCGISLQKMHSRNPSGTYTWLGTYHEEAF